MLAMPLAAQTASYAYIDQKAPYTSPRMLTALNLPKLGTTFQVQVPNSMWCHIGGWTGGGITYYLALGVSNPNVSVPALGGFLFSSAEIVLRAPTPCPNNGFVTMSFPIPNSPGLLGVRFYQQVLAESRGEYVPNTYYLSRGGVGVIGK